MKIDSQNSNLNLRHLQAIHTIWELGTFARAASELGVVPSALSETVRQTEEAIGAPFFDRTQRPPVPTPLGLDFLRLTAPLLEGLRDAIRTTRAEATMESGRLAVGAAPSSITGLVGPALAQFRKQYPGIRCRLHDDIAENLADMLVEGSLDIAIAGRARKTPDIHHTLLMKDSFGLACSRDHRLASVSTITLDQISQDEVISLDASTGTQQLLLSSKVPESLCSGGIEAHTTIAQLCMVRAGLGVAILPENAVRLFGDPAIFFLPITDLDLSRSLYLLEPARRVSSHSARLFVEELKRHQST